MTRCLLIFFIVCISSLAWGDQTDSDEAVGKRRDQAINQIREGLNDLEILTKEYADTKSGEAKEKIREKLQQMEGYFKGLKDDGKEAGTGFKENIKNDVIKLRRNFTPYFREVNDKAAQTVKDGLDSIGKGIRALKQKIKTKSEEYEKYKNDKRQKEEDEKMHIKRT